MRSPGERWSPPGLRIRAQPRPRANEQKQMAQQPVSHDPAAASPMRPRRRRSILKIVLGVLLVALLALIYAAWPGSSTFTVSPETTYVTSPLDKHGYVDYVTALNERLSKGITPESNANVLIWKALGPHPEGATMPPEYFKWLG